MKKLKPLISVPVKFGLLGGILLLILFLIFYFADKNPLILNRKIDIGYIIVAIIFIFFSIMDFKVNRNNSELRYWQGMTVGFFTYLLIAFIYVLFVLFFLEFVHNELLIEYKNDSIKILMEQKQHFIKEIGEKYFEIAIAEMKHKTALSYSYSIFLQKLFIGLVLTVIISIILRR